MEEKSLQDLTTARLKEILREKALSTSGTKNELVARLLEHGTQVDDVFYGGETSRDNDSKLAPTPHTPAQSTELELMKLRLELLEKEKEMALREADLARRELEFARAAQGNAGQPSTRAEVAAVPPEPLRMNITAMADLLNHFDGSEGAFETWSRQLQLLRETYRVQDDACRFLVVSRLRGRAQEWFHSRPEHMTMTIEMLLGRMGSMYDRRPNRLVARRRFEERTWHRGETFADYLHEKVILANRISLNEEELIDYVIDGIPDPVLQDQARLQRFKTNADLLEAFGNITLRPKATNTTGKGGESASKSRSDGAAYAATAGRRCINCGDQGHLTSECPSQGKGRKCFQCNEFGHISRECPTKKEAIAKNVLTVTARGKGKYRKDIRVNGCAALAVLDTGSDISLIRKTVYMSIGAPPLTNEVMRLRGVGSDEYLTLGKFDGEIEIDGERRGVTLHVVEDALLKCGVLLGFDFITTAEWIIKNGTMSLITRPNACDAPAEILYIDCERDRDTIELADVENPEIREQTETVIREYKPKRSRECNVMMKPVLKDDEPVYERARQLASSKREEFNWQNEKGIRDDIVRSSLSEYARPIALVEKNDGTARLCVDCRRLNVEKVRDRYPMVKIYENERPKRKRKRGRDIKKKQKKDYERHLGSYAFLGWPSVGQ
ncbi:uncharacterized protein LOC143266361 [Megachile rotundata]|uniref:uncharacterized protein LOC143266361 n=1 Tax=Megachile rotundata TaxID=143995 RepID=UPI003FD48565